MALKGIALAMLAGAFAAAAEPGQPPPRKYANIERLEPARLKATQADVGKLRAQRTPLPPLPGLTDFRCILHAHAEDSAHTGGTLPEMLADAQKAGVQAILLSEHFRPPRDFITGRWRGVKEGVLFIPGSEALGFLIHPQQSIMGQMQQTGAEFVRTVTADNGLIFLSHIEERPDHALNGLTGLEIYNRHWDAKKDFASLLALGLKLTDPAALAELQESVRAYPAEALAFQCDYPRAYLQKWDEGTAAGMRLTGIAANDCHHNQVFIVKMVDADTVSVGTIVDRDEDLRRFTSTVRPGVKELTKGHQPGDTIARIDFDPYVHSFHNVSTHVLAPALDEASIRLALKAGRAYVAHDWMADPTGFRFQALTKEGQPAGIMGDEVKLTPGMKLQAQLPVPARIRLLFNGREAAAADSSAGFSFTPVAPGAYRVEAWLSLDGEWRPWIYSNPVYLR